MFANGPTIVTNGLVLALDAGDKNSYVSGSTTWFDLTGVNNGTLVNGPTFNSGSGGSIVFDGTNDYVTGSSSNLSEYTLCAMVKVLAYKIGGGILGGTNTANAYLQIGGSNNWQFNNAFISNNTPVLSQWAYINGVQTSASTQLLYLNGNLVTSTSGTSNLGTGYVIGRRELSSVYLNCQVGLAQIYNRALTASEVLQNYNSQKSRFGLT